MDPISIIITALITGAAAALKPTTEQIVKDAYSGVKDLIQSKYRGANLPLLEADPASKVRQAVVKEDLEKGDAGQDKELLRQAKALLEAIQSHAPEAARAVGVSLKDISGAALELEEILAEGTDATGVQLEHGTFTGDIKIKGVTARGGDTPPKK